MAMALNGPTRSVRISPGADEREIPSTPRRCTLPKLSFNSFKAGVAVSVWRTPPRSISILSACPALTETIRCISEKLSIRVPSIDITVSPGWKPASAAALPGATLSTRAAVICLPYSMKMPAKITMARMKLAIGPAATTAAREPTGLWKKLSLLSAALISCSAS